MQMCVRFNVLHTFESICFQMSSEWVKYKEKEKVIIYLNRSLWPSPQTGTGFVDNKKFNQADDNTLATTRQHVPD